MTSREAFEAWAEDKGWGGEDPDFPTWQAAERDMLERAVALVSRFQSCPDKFAICDELKELLNEQ